MSLMFAIQVFSHPPTCTHVRTCSPSSSSFSDPHMTYANRRQQQQQQKQPREKKKQFHIIIPSHVLSLYYGTYQVATVHSVWYTVLARCPIFFSFRLLPIIHYFYYTFVSSRLYIFRKFLHNNQPNHCCSS